MPPLLGSNCIIAISLVGLFSWYTKFANVVNFFYKA